MCIRDRYQTLVSSFTKGTSYELTLSSHQISEADHVLIIDDFLANGEAATGALRLLRKAHATTAGVGALIEKSFQPGREKLEEMCIRDSFGCLFHHTISFTGIPDKMRKAIDRNDSSAIIKTNI